MPTSRAIRAEHEEIVARKHMEALVAAINPTTIAVAIPAEIDDAEATDVTLYPGMEQVDVGPFDGKYLRLIAPDLVVAVDAARRLLTEIEAAVFDAREDKARAAQVPCPGCDTLIDPDVPDCGFASCRARAQAEARVEAYL